MLDSGGCQLESHAYVKPTGTLGTKYITIIYIVRPYEANLCLSADAGVWVRRVGEAGNEIDGLAQKR